MSEPVVSVSHDSRGFPRVELVTRMPTRYDSPHTIGGKVPEHAETGATAALVILEAGPGGNVRVVIEASASPAQIVLVIDRATFTSWVEQLDHLRDRIRAGY